MISWLDNPFWNALTGLDTDKNQGADGLAYFDADMAPFIAMPFWDADRQRTSMNRIDKDRSWFVLIRDDVRFIDDLEIVFSIPLYQMVCHKLPTHQQASDDTQIIPLTTKHVDEMIALTTLTRPGPFVKRTIEFGNYHGILKHGKLIAMGGERIHVGEFTEISAICTHPDHQGLGYAADITHHLATSVMQKGQMPFLHVRFDNTKAIDLYERLGFEIRTRMNFYIIKRK